MNRHPMNVKQLQAAAAAEASFFEGDHAVAALPG
jgi:hypothetical protein